MQEGKIEVCRKILLNHTINYENNVEGPDMGALLQGLGSLLGGEQKTGKATKPKKVSSDKTKPRKVRLELNLKIVVTTNC